MRKANVSILASVLAIALVATGIGMGTMAYFFDTATSNPNVFTAGDCDIKLYIPGGGSADAFLTATDMKPGDSVSGTLIIENSGTVDIKFLPMDVEIIEDSDGGSDGIYLDDHLIVDVWDNYLKKHDWSTFHYCGSDYSSDDTLRHFADTRYNGDPLDDSMTEISFGGVPKPVECKGANYWIFEPGDKLKLEFTITFTETYTNQNAAENDIIKIKFTFDAFTDYECP